MTDVWDASAPHFNGPVMVGSRIIDSLSSGLYQNPASCLKELVNNSYDADATTVNVFVKPDGDVIIVEDDGVGMSREIFEEHFSKVSESHKRDDTDRTDKGRPKIGHIGIGFIAANELCEQMEIFSTQRGSTDLLHVIIDFELMRNPPEDRRTSDGEYQKGDYEGEVLQTEPEEHGTQIFLQRVRGTARAILVGASVRGRNKDSSIYGLKPSSIARRLGDISSWTSLDDYSQTVLGVALNVPVSYHEGWCPKEHKLALTPFTEQAAGLDFNVLYDGTALHKPVVLGRGPSSDRTLLRDLDWEGEHCAVKGYLYAQHGTIKPEEVNGILVRIRNAAVGEYRNDYLGFPHAEGALFQRWVTGELWADDRLEVALNIDRRTLRDTHPAYVELRNWFHDELGSFLADVRRVMYAAASRDRKKDRAEAELSRLRRSAADLSEHLGPDLARELTDAWTAVPKPAASSRDTSPAPPHQRDPAAADADARRLFAALHKKFTVGQVYDIAVESAKASLSAPDAARFIAELTRRLRG